MKVYRAICGWCDTEMVSYNGRVSSCKCGLHFLDGDDYMVRVGGNENTMSELIIEDVDPVEWIDWRDSDE